MFRAKNVDTNIPSCAIGLDAGGTLSQTNQIFQIHFVVVEIVKEASNFPNQARSGELLAFRLVRKIRSETLRNESIRICETRMSKFP
jgi:hypothetical protein